MSTIHPSPLLRFALLADAAASGASGLLVLLGAAALEPLLGLDAAFLRGVGAFCVAYGGLILWLGLRPALPPAAVIGVIVANAGWVVASLAAIAGGLLLPTAAGVGFIIAQAVAVGVLADLQFLGLRRSAAVPA